MRNWKKYNHELVKRYEFWVSKEMVEEWNKEIMNRNKGKRGRPFQYADGFILLLMKIKMILRLTYRGIEGLLKH